MRRYSAEAGAGAGTPCSRSNRARSSASTLAYTARSLRSARMMARHKTSYALLLDSVSPATREAYRTLTGQ